MEKYGEVPKRFTKAWWEYFWYYYKWHTLGALFAIIVVAVTCTQCAMRTKYDVTLTYAGEMVFMPQTVDKINAELSQHIEDIDQNGEAMVNFQCFNIAKEGTSQAGSEYNSAMMTKLAVEFQGGDTYVFLLNRQELDKLLNVQTKAEVFVPLADWVDDGITAVKTAKKNGIDYAVDITNNKLFKDKLGLTMGDSLYIMVRHIQPNDADDVHQQKMYEQSIKLANYILANN